MLWLLNLRVIILSCIISQFPAMRFTRGEGRREGSGDRDRRRINNRISRIAGETRLEFWEFAEAAGGLYLMSL